MNDLNSIIVAGVISSVKEAGNGESIVSLDVENNCSFPVFLSEENIVKFNRFLTERSDSLFKTLQPGSKVRIVGYLSEGKDGSSYIIPDHYDDFECSINSLLFEGATVAAPEQLPDLAGLTRCRVNISNSSNHPCILPVTFTGRQADNVLYKAGEGQHIRVVGRLHAEREELSIVSEHVEFPLPARREIKGTGRKKKQVPSYEPER